MRNCEREGWVQLVAISELFDGGTETKDQNYLWRTGSQGGGGGGAARADDAFSDVAEVLTFLLNDLDLVPSDIAAALLLLHLRQQHERRAGRNGSDASADADAEEARLLQEPLLTTQRPHQVRRLRPRYCRREWKDSGLPIGC